jgi:hypothetical protein
MGIGGIESGISNVINKASPPASMIASAAGHPEMGALLAAPGAISGSSNAMDPMLMAAMGMGQQQQGGPPQPPPMQRPQPMPPQQPTSPPQAPPLATGGGASQAPLATGGGGLMPGGGGAGAGGVPPQLQMLLRQLGLG